MVFTDLTIFIGSICFKLGMQTGFEQNKKSKRRFLLKIQSNQQKIIFLNCNTTKQKPNTKPFIKRLVEWFYLSQIDITAQKPFYQVLH